MSRTKNRIFILFKHLCSQNLPWLPGVHGDGELFRSGRGRESLPLWSGEVTWIPMGFPTINKVIMGLMGLKSDQLANNNPTTLRKVE